MWKKISDSAAITSELKRGITQKLQIPNKIGNIVISLANIAMYKLNTRLPLDNL